MIKFTRVYKTILATLWTVNHPHTCQAQVYHDHYSDIIYVQIGSRVFINFDTVAAAKKYVRDNIEKYGKDTRQWYND